MTKLTPSSAAALTRLRSYISPPSIYTSLPLTRRAAVLLLLFADRNGHLRVLLTLRASGMNSYGGQVALPGGKADSLTETAFETARREADEEVGLPRSDMPRPWKVEHLCELPAQLSATEQGVRPCVAFLHADSSSSSSVAGSETSGDASSLLPKLNATEVAAVFSAPFHRFVSSKTEGSNVDSPIVYDGTWQIWNGARWRMHSFYIPRGPATIIAGSPDAASPSSPAPSTANRGEGEKKQVQGKPIDKANSYRVWGLTARIMIDAARVAYGEDPDFEFLDEIGEEKMIARLFKKGRLAGERVSGSVIPRGPVLKKEDGTKL